MVTKKQRIKFMNISENESRLCFPTILENADKHFFIAEKLSELKEYGSAVSHVVLGVEELIKALIVYLSAMGFGIRQVKGVKRFFTDHKIRHEFAMMLSFMQVIANYLQYLINQIKSNKEKLLKSEEYRKTFFETLLLRLKKRFAKKFMTTVSSLDWWMEADNLKQRGFYVDYDTALSKPHSASHWNFRDVVTEMDYLEKSRGRDVSFSSASALR